MLKKIRTFLKTFIFVELGACFANILQEVVRYKKHPEYYLANSAPWYTDIIVVTILTAIVVLVTFIVWLVLGYFIKRKKWYEQ